MEHERPKSAPQGDETNSQRGGAPPSSAQLGNMPQSSGQLGAPPPGSDQLGAPPSSAQLGNMPQSSGQLGAPPPSSGQLGFASPSPAQFGASPPASRALRPTDPDAPGSTAAPSPPQGRARGATKPLPRFAIALGAVFSLMLTGGAVALYVLTHLDEWIATAVVQKAAERGIIVGIGKLDWSLDGAVLTDTSITLSGVPSTVVHVDRLETDVRVDLSGITIRRLEVQGAQATVLGSAALVGLELGYWTAKYASAVNLPMRASGIDVTWKAAPLLQPWLEISQAQIEPAGDAGTILAESVVIAGQNIGTVGGQWSEGRSDFTIGLGEMNLEAAPIQVNVVYEGEKRSIDAALVPTSLQRLESSFGVELPDEKIEIETRVHLELDTRALDSPAKGWMKASLHGFIPPHPAELDGFVFGNRTDFETQLFVDEARAKIRLENAKVQAGRFVLKGQGVVTRSEDTARLLMDLRAALPCTALAGAAVESRLGKVIGPWMRRAAEAALQGSVTVTVKLDADSRHLDQIKMAKLIGVGCGLKPLKLPGIEDFELPVLSSLPKLGDLLPTMPSTIPSITGRTPRAGQPATGLGLPGWKSLGGDVPNRGGPAPGASSGETPPAPQNQAPPAANSAVPDLTSTSGTMPTH